MHHYNLGFISDEDLFSHGKDTVENMVFEELSTISPNLLKSLYLLSFGKV
ncbi:hypothetical protein KKC13_07540 [bacterium]|nr:hypothetical protein [bacterium]MBU1958236.1 hypothetical protein [bacterium]